jgi:hypothetical protein
MELAASAQQGAGVGVAPQWGARHLPGVLGGWRAMSDDIEERPAALCHCGQPASQITRDGIALCESAALMLDSWTAPRQVLITTRQLAEREGITVQGIGQRVRRGTLTPAVVLENGHWLFIVDEQEQDHG